MLNKNVPDKYKIIDDEIIRLAPLLEYYGKPKIGQSPDAQAYNQSSPAYTNDNMSYNPFGNPNNPNLPPQQAAGPLPACVNVSKSHCR